LPQPGTNPQTDANQHANQQTGASAQTSANLQTAVAAEKLNLGLQFGPATARGLTISSIDRGSFFFTSGLQPADILVSVAGQPVRTFAEFNRFIALYPNQRVPLVVLRGGQRETIYITPPATEKSIIARAPAQTLPSVETPSVLSVPLLGVTFDAQFPTAAIVRIVDQGSPADRAGLRPGDMILALDRVHVSTPQDVAQVIRQTQFGQQIGIDYSRRIQAHAEATLATTETPAPYTAAYPPQVQAVTPAPGVVATRPVEPSTGIVPAYSSVPASAVLPVPPNAVRPGDPNGNGRRLDGDGRLPRRAVRPPY
jgi:S1-C subfamily serine protease